MNKKLLIVIIICAVVIAGVIASAIFVKPNNDSDTTTTTTVSTTTVSTTTTTTTTTGTTTSTTTTTTTTANEDSQNPPEDPPHIHTEVVDIEVSATCTNVGLTEGKHCSECGEVIVAQATVPMLDHTYDDDYDRFCNVCNYERQIYCRHDIPEKIEVVPAKAPTCQKAGATEGMKCLVCGVMVVPQISVPVIECVESDWITDDDGSRHTECIFCGKLIKEVSPSELSGTYDGSAVTITFWHAMGADNKALLKDAIARFNETYPNITVEHQSYGDYDGVFDQIKTKLTAGKQPNLAFCYPDHVATYNKAGAVVVLDDLINNQNVLSSGEMMGFTQAQLDDFIEGYYNEGKEYGDGKMYSLPFQKSTEVLYYNKTVFDALGLEAPETWDDVEAIIQVLKEEYPNSIPLGYDSEENMFITLAEQYGSSYTSSIGENYLFVNDTNKEFLAKFAEWYQKGWLTTSALMGGSYTSDGFKKADDEIGKIFMSIGSSLGARYQRPDKVNGEYPFEVGIVSIPQVDPSKPKVISQGPSICIFEDENVQEVYASWLFLKFLTTDQRFQAEYAMKSGYVPVIKSVMETDEYKNVLNKADGGDFITSLALVVAIQQQEAYFSSPAFDGSANARTQVGLLLQSVFAKYELGKDNSAMIDSEFQKYYEQCLED